MEGRWYVQVSRTLGHTEPMNVTRDASRAQDWRDFDREVVPVVPCDDDAIDRAARGLARSFGEEAGFADWRRVARTALRAAGETP